MLTTKIGSACHSHGRWRLAIGALAMAVCLLPHFGLAAAPRIHSPFDLQFNRDGTRLAVSDRTAGVLHIVDTVSRQVLRRVRLHGEPTGVAWEGKSVFVAEYGAGTVAEVGTDRGTVIRRLRVGPKPLGVAVVPSRRLLLAAAGGPTSP